MLLDFDGLSASQEDARGMCLYRVDLLRARRIGLRIGEEGDNLCFDWRNIRRAVRFNGAAPFPQGDAAY